MIKENYTHLAKIYSIPCYFNEETMEVKGTNLFYDLLIELRVKIESLFSINDGFYVEIIKPL